MANRTWFAKPSPFGFGHPGLFQLGVPGLLSLYSLGKVRKTGLETLDLVNPKVIQRRARSLKTCFSTVLAAHFFLAFPLDKAVRPWIPARREAEQTLAMLPKG
jgi:hypothetical protein